MEIDFFFLKKCWRYKCSPLITSLHSLLKASKRYLAQEAKFGTQELQDPECQGVDC